MKPSALDVVDKSEDSQREEKIDINFLPIIKNLKKLFTQKNQLIYNLNDWRKPNLLEICSIASSVKKHS